MVRKLLLTLIISLFMALPVCAQEEPADSMIKAVVADLDKYEKQSEGLTTSDKRYINNILRFLPMTEARLNCSGWEKVYTSKRVMLPVAGLSGLSHIHWG